MAVNAASAPGGWMKGPKLDKLKLNATYAGFIGRVLYYSMVRLADKKPNSVALHVERWARETPDNPSIFYEDRRYSWEQFNREANRVASVLRRLGARTDESVALLMDNRPEYLFTIVGANKLGMATGLVNTKLTGDGLVHALTITNADWVIVGSELAANLEEVIDRASVPRDRVIVWSDGEDDGTVEGAQSMDTLLETAARVNPGLAVHDAQRVFLYICTSGTTGLPKAALIRNQRYLKAVYYFGQGVLRVRSDDVTYTCGMPLYHNAGISQGWGIALTGGAACALRRKFSVSRFWDDVDRYGVTIFTYIGEICRYLLAAPPHARERSHRLRGIIGAGMRPDVWVPFVERFNIPNVYEYYGATEGNVGLVNLANRPGMVGRLMRGNLLVRVDPDTEEFLRDGQGHLIPCQVGESGIMIGLIHDMAPFEGYADKSKNASKIIERPFGKDERYFNTGDLLTLHEDGFVSFADRLGDTFRWKGENVSTNDVQEQLLKHPSVHEANVYGVTVEGQDGRAGAAALVVDETFDPAAFATFVRNELPAYAQPLFIRLEQELPMTGSFKLVKTGFKADGFDPAKISTPLYFLDADKGYVKLTKKLYQQIQSGSVRL